jgi:hypothetical protein
MAGRTSRVGPSGAKQQTLSIRARGLGLLTYIADLPELSEGGAADQGSVTTLNGFILSRAAALSIEFYAFERRG